LYVFIQILGCIYILYIYILYIYISTAQNPIYIYIYIYVCMYVYTYVCMYIRMYIRTYTRTHTRTHTYIQTLSHTQINTTYIHTRVSIESSEGTLQRDGVSGQTTQHKSQHKSQLKSQHKHAPPSWLCNLSNYLVETRWRSRACQHLIHSSDLPFPIHSPGAEALRAVLRSRPVCQRVISKVFSLLYRMYSLYPHLRTCVQSFAVYQCVSSDPLWSSLSLSCSLARSLARSLSLHASCRGA
jgi:hypothetical protein